MESKIKIRKRFVPSGMSILYEDRDIIVIDKSVGLLSVSARYEDERTAQQLLTNYVRKGNAKARQELFAVHRLDRETSGVLIFAKSMAVREKFAEHWTEVRKRYLALVYGRLEQKSGVLESYLAEDENYVVRSVTDPSKGKLARTGYKVVKENDKFSLLEIELLTGRKNQIRVQLADLSHPVVGDIKYGKYARRTKGRLMLHAWSISFTNPVTGEDMRFEAKIPFEFSRHFTT
jgi:RluA family pseudouridine synthase